MKTQTSRRVFLQGLAGATSLGMAGCCNCLCGSRGQKIKLAAVGVMGKGYSDWTPTP